MIAKEIKKKVKERGYFYSEVAEKCGWSPAGFSVRLKNDNLKECDILKIADALDCTVEIKFIDK